MKQNNVVQNTDIHFLIARFLRSQILMLQFHYRYIHQAISIEHSNVPSGTGFDVCVCVCERERERERERGCTHGVCACMNAMYIYIL